MEITSFIAPDGTELIFDADDLFLLTEEGTGLPPVTYITQKGPTQHGETVLDYRLGARTLQFYIRKNNCDRYAYWLSRLHLLNMIRPNRHPLGVMQPSVLRKKFPDGRILDINVVIQEGPIFTARDLGTWDEWGYQETLRFIAHDPVYYDPTQKSKLWDTLSDEGSGAGLIFPMSFSFALGESAFGLSGSVIYNGTWLSFPNITLTGPMSGFTFRNESTDEQIEMNYTIAADEIVYIRLPYGNKTVTNDSGDNLIGTITTASDIASFHIAPDPEVPGGVNEFTLAMTGTDANSRALLEYYERFIGF